jgi:hypothetical protein
MGVEFYSGPSVQDVLEYRFDFDVPVHCTQTTSCGDNPMTNVSGDKSPRIMS